MKIEFVLAKSNCPGGGSPWPKRVDQLLRVCAVERRRFPVGARPTRQPLQPEATGSRLGDLRECAGRNASERRASLEKDNAQADPTAISGKADTTGTFRRRPRPSLTYLCGAAHSSPLNAE